MFGKAMSSQPTLCRDCAKLIPAGPICPDCGSARLVSHAELLDLTIAHIDCDAFYASVEKRDDPSLHDKPLLVGHPGGRGVVTTACYIARRFGPRSAMPMFKALELCPHAVVIPPDMAKYKQASQAIRVLMVKATPLVEPLSLDEAYLDLSPEHRLIDRAPVVILARLARAIERDVGVTVSIGLSYNKSLAKLASDREKPRGLSVIGRAEAKSILAPLPVGAIHGIGRATARRLEADGITTVAQLQAMSEAALVARMGKFGRALAERVHGIDGRRIVPDRPLKSVSVENTFARDQRALEPMAEELRDLTEKLVVRLQRAGVGGATVVLKLKTGDFKSLSRQIRLPHPTQRFETIWDQGLTLLKREADGRPFRLIGIGLAELAPAADADPPDLFN
jgi:DNA polymerase-4